MMTVVMQCTTLNLKSQLRRACAVRSALLFGNLALYWALTFYD